VCRYAPLDGLVVRPVPSSPEAEKMPDTAAQARAVRSRWCRTTISHHAFRYVDRPATRALIVTVTLRSQRIPQHFRIRSGSQPAE